jgi:Fe-S-cluster containining protein
MDELLKRTQEIYTQFEAEVQLLHLKEPLWHSCQACPDGYCCRNEKVPVMKHEWERLIHFVKNEMPANHKRRLESQIDKGKSKCPFLMHDRCMVYPVRAWTCRIYPYTISTHRIAHAGNFIAPYCNAYRGIFSIREGPLESFPYVVLETADDSHLVKIRINDQHEFWVIDITEYALEFYRLLPKDAKGVLDGDDMHNWVGAVRYLRDSRRIDQSKFLELLGLD